MYSLSLCSWRMYWVVGHDGWHSFLWVWVWMTVRGSFCLFWREIHTKRVRARLPTRPEEDEGRKVPESGEETSRQNRTVSKIEQSTDVGGSRQSREERWLLGPVNSEAGLANMRKWWLCGNFALIHAHDSSQKYRMLGKYHKHLFCAWS